MVITKEHLDIEKNHPLNDMQKGMIFEISRNDYLDPIYIAQMTFSIKNKLDIPIFLKAFKEVSKRHDSLRSSIQYDTSEHTYIQHIYKSSKIPTEIFDYQHMESNEKNEKFNLFLQNDVKNPFSFSIPPLMRLAIFCFDPEDYRIVWTRHHILMDGASVQTVLQELFSVYNMILHNNKISLPKAKTILEQDLYHEQLNINYASTYWTSKQPYYNEASFLPAASAKTNLPKRILSKKFEIFGERLDDLIKFDIFVRCC